MRQFFYLILITAIFNVVPLNSKGLDNNLLKQAKKFGDIEYIKFVDVATLFKENLLQANNNELIFENAVLRVSPGSFFVFYENKNEIKIGQMSSPAIDYNDKTYLPLESFYKALLNKQILQNNVEDIENNSDHKKMEESPIKVFKMRNTYSEPREENINKNSTEQNIDVKNIDNPDSKQKIEKKKRKITKEITPDYYFLPDGLIRTELQDTIYNK